VNEIDDDKLLNAYAIVCRMCGWCCEAECGAFLFDHELEEVRKGLIEAGIEVEEAKLELIPTTTTRVEGETAQKVLKLLMALEDLDDVQEVYSNFDMPEEVMNNA